MVNNCVCEVCSEERNKLKLGIKGGSMGKHSDDMRPNVRFIIDYLKNKNVMSWKGVHLEVMRKDPRIRMSLGDQEECYIRLIDSEAEYARIYNELHDLNKIHNYIMNDDKGKTIGGNH